MAGKKLERAANAKLGGVCSGMARYFGVDPVIVRIVFVGGALITGGLLAIAYIALTLALPKASAQGDVFDVEPESAISDRFGPMNCRQACKKDLDSCDQKRVGVGHLPPEPPVSWRR